ncbi:MAG: DNAJC11 domain-containing protein [Terriglobales bacterium]
MKRLAVVLVLLVLALPGFAQYRSEPISEIVRADYGWGNRWVDVTQRVRSLVRDGALNFQVHPDYIGVDPIPHGMKVLRLEVRQADGDLRRLEYRDKDYVSIQVQPVFWGSQFRNNIVEVIRAEYGWGNHFVDVTDRVRSFVRNGVLNFQVHPDFLGVDPNPGRAKILRLEVRERDGDFRRIQFRDKEYVNLSISGNGSRGYRGGRLQIIRADYGVLGRTIDVTQRLNSYVRRDRINVLVSNQLLGGDPAPRERKQLTVTYTFNGRRLRAIVNEGEYLDLPPAGVGR